MTDWQSENVCPTVHLMEDQMMSVQLSYWLSVWKCLCDCPIDEQSVDVCPTVHLMIMSVQLFDWRTIWWCMSNCPTDGQSDNVCPTAQLMANLLMFVRFSICLFVQLSVMAVNWCNNHVAGRETKSRDLGGPTWLKSTLYDSRWPEMT